MNLIDLPLDSIHPPESNPNEMNSDMMAKLRRSIKRFGLVVPLVVRQIVEQDYETIGGAQRLAVARELGLTTLPCVVVQANDAEARLLSQALNRIAGEDNLGLRAQLLKKVLENVPQSEVLALLPETPSSLEELSTLGQQDVADYLAARERAKTARLRHLAFQLTDEELNMVEQAISHAIRSLKEQKSENPNLRGRALAAISQAYLATKRLYAAYRELPS